MKLVIFGASGRTGGHLVEQALRAGHEVTAAVRSPDRLEGQHADLRVVRAELHDGASVEAAVAGHDVVVNVAGRTRDSGGDVLEAAARTITSAMRRTGARRLIALAGAGLDDPRDQPRSLSGRVMMGIMKRVASGVLEDAERYGRIIRSTDLDWTIVRPPRLREGAGDGRYRTGYLQLGLGDSIERGDVARFILECAEDDRWIGEAPMVAD